MFIISLSNGPFWSLSLFCSTFYVWLFYFFSLSLYCSSVSMCISSELLLLCRTFVSSSKTSIQFQIWNMYFLLLCKTEFSLFFMSFIDKKFNQQYIYLIWIRNNFLLWIFILFWPSVITSIYWFYGFKKFSYLSVACHHVEFMYKTVFVTIINI